VNFSKNCELNIMFSFCEVMVNLRSERFTGSLLVVYWCSH
jgi:hypothetical protein